MCVKVPPGDLNPGSCSPTFHKYLYLWSDPHTKGAQWYLLGLLSEATIVLLIN